MRDGVVAAFDRVCKSRPGAQLLISCGNVYSSSHRGDGREHSYSFLAEMRTRIRIGRDGIVRDGIVRDGFVRDGVEAAFDRVCKSRPGAQLLISCGNVYSSSHRGEMALCEMALCEMALRLLLIVFVKDGREHSYSFLAEMCTRVRIGKTAGSTGTHFLRKCVLEFASGEMALCEMALCEMALCETALRLLLIVFVKVGREHSYSFLAEMRTRIRIGRTVGSTATHFSGKCVLNFAF